MPAFAPAAAGIEQKPAAIAVHVQGKPGARPTATPVPDRHLEQIHALTAGYAQNFWIGALVRNRSELVGVRDEWVPLPRFRPAWSGPVVPPLVDVRVAMVLENTEVPVQPDVDAGRLDQLGFVRVELDPPGSISALMPRSERSTLATYRFRYDVWANTAQARPAASTTKPCSYARV